MRRELAPSSIIFVIFIENKKTLLFHRASTKTQENNNKETKSNSFSGLFLRSQTVYGGLVETLGHIPEIIRIYIKLYYNFNLLDSICQ